MPWHPIGQARCTSPALPLAPVCEFWQRLLQTDPTQHRAPEVPPPLHVYPNCYLLHLHLHEPRTARFLFAVPFADAVAWIPTTHTDDGPLVWRAPAPLEAAAAGASFQICRTLELRIRLLTELCIEQARGADELATQAAYAWLDAHLLMACAIDALGFAPTDESSTMALLLARYAPAHYMALREADLPDLSRELERCNLFVGGVDPHKEDAFVDLFSKALPRTYDTRDLVTKVADSAVRNAGFFDFLKLALAATQLGLYAHARERAPYAVRYAVYRLFFFELDPALRAHGVGAPTPGTAASVRSAFDLSQLVARIEQHQRSAGDLSRIEVQYLSYTKSLAHTYDSSTAARKAKAVESGTDGVVRRSRKKTLHVAVCTHPKSTATAGRRAAEWTAGDSERACRLPLPSTWDGAVLLERTSLQLGERASADSVCGALFARNSMARLVYERNCGTDAYEQRRAAGRLDPDAPAAPAAPWAVIDYTAAATTLQLPCDLAPPSEERLQADAVIFEWLTTSAVQYAAAAARRPSATSSVQPRSSRRKKSDFVFQATMLLAVREYIVFALRRWCAPLRRAYERLVHWSAWETQLLESARRFRFDVGSAAQAATTATGRWPVHELLIDVASHLALTLHAPQTQFRPHSETFLGALLHRFALVSRGYQVKVRDQWRTPYDLEPVDGVLPRETEVLLRHSLAHWHYPHSLPAAATELPIEPCTSDDGANHHQPLDFTIEPVSLAAAAAATGSVGSRGLVWTAELISDALAKQARYPLEVFHASAESIARFGACRAAYRAATSVDAADTCIKAYVEWLAGVSAYQYQLMYAFCRAVDRHLHIRTFPLPRHIVEHQMRALRNQNCMPTDAELPPHLLRGLVCVGCARVATFLPPTEQRQSTMAFGNDEIRVLTTPSDDEHVFEAVRRRTRPMPLEQLGGADSWLSVLYHRARDAPPVYDRYCGAESHEATDAQLWAPESVGLLPLDATDADIAARVQRIFGVSGGKDDGTPHDRRRQLHDSSLAEPQMVARGRGRLGELLFADALWQAANERVAQFGGMADGGSFLLLGHTMPNSDPRYTRMRFACKSHCSRSETKKSKQSAGAELLLDVDLDDVDLEEPHEASTAATATDSLAEEARAARFATKQCRDAQANAIYTACGRELMREIDYLGRALYYTTLDASKRIAWDACDFVAICCDCLAATRSGDLRPIADRIVCKSCYAASRLCSGSVALRVARGESTKTAVTAVPNALTSDSLQAVHGTARQTLFSPSYAVLCNEVVGAGTVCALDRCKAVKSAETAFYGLEVLCDTDIGNETFGFIYFCATHARLYRPLFNSATRLPLSTVRYFMADSKRFAGNVGMHGNFLENIMRGDARATEHHFQTELAKQVDTKKRGAVQKRRAQRKRAIIAGAREADTQERANVDRLLLAGDAADLIE